MNKNVKIFTLAILAISVLSAPSFATCEEDWAKCKNRYKVVHNEYVTANCNLRCATTLLDETFKKDPMEITTDEQNTYNQCLKECESSEHRKIL